MQNNKLHFKMYKSGKNWMVAGLMTTAVLAGLTLSNTNNDVVAHADTTPVAAQTTSTQPADVQQAQKAADDADANLAAVKKAHENVNPSDDNNNTGNNEKKDDNGAQTPSSDKNNGVANNTAANKTVEVSAVATPAAVTMTRAEYKNAQNNNAAKSNNLPQTGNENSAAVMALGAVSAMLGLGMVAKKREF